MKKIDGFWLFGIALILMLIGMFLYYGYESQILGISVAAVAVIIGAVSLLFDSRYRHLQP